MSGWTNPCGGTQWRELPDGSLEVEGAGVPEYAPGTDHFRYLEQTWRNWGRHFRRSANDFGVPVSWLLAIAAVETGPWSDDAREQETIRSPAGAIGIMQIMPATAKLLRYAPADMADAATNIMAGAELIARLDGLTSGGLPSICGAYNSGKFCCSDPSCGPGCQNRYRVCTAGDYPGAAIRYNNAALAHLQLSSPFLLYAAAAAVGAGIAGAAVVISQR